MLVRQGLADRLQIVAGIEPRGNLADLLAQGLAVAQKRRARQGIDLAAGIVDVVLARHVVAGEGQQIRQRIAEGCPATVAHVQGTRRVHRDIFHVHAVAAAKADAPVARPFFQDGGDDALPERRPEGQVDEAGPRHLDLFDVGVGLELCRQQLGDVARLHLRRLRQHHGRIGGEIAVRGIARRGHLDVLEVETRGKRTLGLQRGKRVEDATVHERIDVHRDPPSLQDRGLPSPLRGGVGGGGNKLGRRLPSHPTPNPPVKGRGIPPSQLHGSLYNSGFFAVRTNLEPMRRSYRKSGVASNRRRCSLSA